MSYAPKLKIVGPGVSASGSADVAGGGNPPYDGDMEARVIKLEDFAVDTRERLTRIETRLDQTATKADLHELSASMIKWMVGTAVGLGVAAITIMTFVLNNAAPKVTSGSSAPIIITIPSAPIAPQSAPQVPAVKQ